MAVLTKCFVKLKITRKCCPRKKKPQNAVIVFSSAEIRNSKMRIGMFG